MLGLDILVARSLQPEIMDEPGMSGQRHALALRGLERINAWSGSARILWPSLAGLSRENQRSPLRVLDVASGAGDVSIRLWHKARRSGLHLDLAGCDRSSSAVTHAQRRAAECGAEVAFIERDALQGELPNGYDVVMTSLFLHHLTEDEAVALLRRMAYAARRLVLVSDLARSVLGLSLAYVGTRLLSRSPVVHVDGPRSVRAAFTVREACSLADRAGLDRAAISRHWPCRFLLAWRKT